MFARLVGTLLGCWHSNYSFPMTLNARRRPSNESPRTYVVCLDCGRELPYDWSQMRIMSRSRSKGTSIESIEHIEQMPEMLGNAS